jgi:prevent-host-death family protein
MVMSSLTIQPTDRSIPAGEFKAKCLKLMDEVNATQRPITVTKRGKPVGKFVPMPVEEKLFRSVVGRSPGIKILGDIISPLPQEWTLPEWAWDKPKKADKKAKKKK